jgi:hypothetical protein
MKTFLTFILFANLFCLFSQTNKKITYELYSDIWVYDKEKNKFLPKNADNFTIYDKKKMSEKIDINKINSLLLSSFNNFRKDYNKRPVKENKRLSELCSDLVNSATIEYFEHSPTVQEETEYELSGYNFSGEVIATSTLYVFSRVDLDKVDINKIIADSFFDEFINSTSHMKLLLLDDKDNYEYGFGISIRNNGDIFICSRSIYK